jgi:site-specific recombinase XerD
MTPSLTAPVISGVRVAGGPLSAYTALYRAKLEELRFAPSMILHRLRIFAEFELWLRRRKLRVRPLDEPTIERFLVCLRRKHPCFSRGARSALRLLLTLLRDAGAVAPKQIEPAGSPAQRLVNTYRQYLLKERGLVRGTIYSYSRHIDQFLFEHYNTGRVNLRALRATDITAFVRREAPRYGRGRAAEMVTGLRSFFRFARYQGLIGADLAAVVPAVANWSLAGLPKYLPPGAVSRVLGACDRSTVHGKRNYALLLLLARLGLRAGEIVALQLDDIDWANGELAVRSNKGVGWARLPLPADVGRALAQYLAGRPQSAYRNVFVRDHAPYTPFAASGPVSVLVRTAIEKAGVKSARTGAHVFRHTLATEMLRRGASLDEIGQVLRHRDPNSTMIYAKVDIEALRQLALPWPGGAR